MNSIFSLMNTAKLFIFGWWLLPKNSDCADRLFCPTQGGCNSLNTPGSCADSRLNSQSGVCRAVELPSSRSCPSQCVWRRRGLWRHVHPSSCILGASSDSSSAAATTDVNKMLRCCCDSRSHCIRRTTADCQPTAPVPLVSLVQSAGTLYRTIWSHLTFLLSVFGSS